METKVDINEVKKDLYRSKEFAEFSHYCEGKLYYTVNVFGKAYQFPILTTETGKETVSLEYFGETIKSEITLDVLRLSADLGKTAFSKSIKGSDLIRWIQKAVDTDDFIKISL